MGRYLTVDEIQTRTEALGTDPDNAGIAGVFDLNHRTGDGNRQVKCIKIGKTTAGITPIPVLIVGGIHAREWAPPDALLDFAERLLRTYKAGTAYTDKRFVMTVSDKDSNDAGYTGRIVFDETSPALFSHPDIHRVLTKIELYIVPCVNPDGRHFSQQPGNIPGVLLGGNPLEKKWWRKNRKSHGTCLDGSPAIGVDINRNFSPVPSWDIDKYYNAATLSDPKLRSRIAVSTVKDSSRSFNEFMETYHGITTPENETQNLIDLVNAKKIKFFLDVHSFQREIYFPWGVNENQTTDTVKSQYNPKWDNTAANTTPSQQGRPLNNPASAAPEPYQEYFPTDSAYDLRGRHIALATSMHNLILSASGSDIHARRRSSYAVKPAFELYSAPGDSSDFVFSTQLEKDPASTPAGNKVRLKSIFPVHSFTIEAGHSSDGQFWPSQLATKNQFLKVRREIQFGVIGMLKYIATWSGPPAPAPGAPPAPSPGPASPPPSSGCLPLILLPLSSIAGTLYLLMRYFSIF